MTAPRPPRPACRPSWLIVANGIKRSPAGPIDADLPAGAVLGAGSGPPPRAADSPQRSPAGRHSTAGSSRPRPSTKTTVGSSKAPERQIASTPARFAAIAKCDEQRASQTRPVSGPIATTANLAEVVSGVPTSGLKAKTSGASGSERVEPRRALVRDDPGPQARPRR